MTAALRQVKSRRARQAVAERREARRLWDRGSEIIIKDGEVTIDGHRVLHVTGFEAEREVNMDLNDCLHPSPFIDVTLKLRTHRGNIVSGWATY